jgi:tetratricopeptide (TPR) repeat protein
MIYRSRSTSILYLPDGLVWPFAIGDSDRLLAPNIQQGTNLVSRPDLTLLIVLTTLLFSHGQSFAQPQVTNVVARNAAPLKIGDRVTGQAEPGEIFSMITRQDQQIWVQNDSGKKGWLSVEFVVNLDQAEPIYEALIRHQPDRAVHYERRAVMWSSRGDSAQAAEDYDRAIQLGSKNANTYFNRGIHHAINGRFAEAVADYDRAIQMGMTDGPLYVNRGVARYAMGDFEDAIADFDQAIAEGLTGLSIYVNRASAHLAAGNHDRAIDDLNEAIRLAPQQPDGYFERGRAWQQMDKLDQAVTDFSRAIELDEDFVPAYRGRGFVWFLKGDSEKAIADFDRWIQRQPESPSAYNNRGFNLQRLGRYREALADFQRSRELAPQYLLAMQNTAWLLATCPDDEIRDAQAALEIARQAHQISEGQSIGVMKAMAAAYAASGDFEEAIAWQNQVIEQLPEDQQADEQELLDLYHAEKPYRMD